MFQDDRRASNARNPHCGVYHTPAARLFSYFMIDLPFAEFRHRVLVTRERVKVVPRDEQVEISRSAALVAG